ncbi:small ubiquitin-related modifier-like [Paramacrobiotus metropolitanus]|uniref:small ubiquitin-related modifier-like n=1 Tax=Paramacrobiotus metropolitanus TaxID=2943436 RepID=UPI002445AF6D|nr:small ubiquitin-related modifier-like [Paramacrobiotus metropolitanus]
MEEDAEEEADNLENSENEPEKSEDNRREKKPRIDIKVSAQDGNEVCFKVSRNVRMQKLMNTFAETIKADVTSLRFMLGSKRVRGDDTPTTLEIDEDNNEIQVHFPLHGG